MPYSQASRGWEKGQPYRFIHGHNKPGLGKSRSEATKAKIGDANRGRRLSDEHKEKIGSALRGREDLKGSARYNWSGDNPSYLALHKRIHRTKDRTGVCSTCNGNVGFGKSGTHWANISGEYLNDSDDFVELCIPCHRRMDAERRRAEKFSPV